MRRRVERVTLQRPELGKPAIMHDHDERGKGSNNSFTELDDGT